MLFRAPTRLYCFHYGTSTTSAKDRKAFVQVNIEVDSSEMKKLRYCAKCSLPDSFPASQMFAIIILPNGGPDLEAFTFATPSSKMGWRQACSVFWQVVKSLAKAEDLVRFEVCIQSVFSSCTFRHDLQITLLPVVLLSISIVTFIGAKYWSNITGRLPLLNRRQRLQER